MTRRKELLGLTASVLAALVLFCLGCSNTEVSFHAGTLAVNHQNYAAERVVGEDMIDCAEIVGFDAQGNRIYGPVREPFGATISRSDVPLKVKSMTVDYLRNCGYPLKVATFSTDFEDDGNHTISNPVLQNHPAPTSTWAASYTPPGELPVSSGALGAGAQTCALKMNDACFKVKGMCYSPSPINYDSSAFPALGDLFWDSFKPQGGSTVWNWYSLWGNGQLYDNFYARDDLSTMRGLGVNAIRLYVMMSRQPLANGNFPESASTGIHFLHKMFLDKCYDNGNRPIYVLVGMPMSTGLFQKGQPTKANEQKFWEYILSETGQDLGSHPAVMGFTIMNELDAEPWSHVSNGSTAGSDKADQFYYKSIEYGNTIKAKAPGKLVGWATHDCPPLYKYAALAKFTAGPLKDKPYLEELAKAFDYWGVNTYQASTFDSLLGNPPMPNGYSFRQIPDNTKKPVIFTELGWPSTGRDQSGNIMYSDTTGKNAAEYITRMYGLAYGATYSDIFAGAFYFEFSDEWWKSGNATRWNATASVPHETVWPNGYNDQEGYGLFGAKKGAGKQNTDDIWCGSGPCLPQDEYVPRLKVTDAITSVYKNISQ